MVLKIVVVKDAKPIDQYVVSGDATSIGRRSECDIPIKDPAVSGNHAEIQQVKGRFILQDLGSTNGLYIAGRKITQHVLKDGDIISVGEHQLRVMLSDAAVGDKARELKAARDQKVAKVARQATRDAADQDKTRVRAVQDKESTAAPRKASVAPKDGEGLLIVLTGEKTGEKMALDQALTTIGEPGVQVAAVSRRPQGHFIIHVDGGKDKDRVPLVNGEPTGFKSRKLEPGDRIEVAGVEMEYQL